MAARPALKLAVGVGMSSGSASSPQACAVAAQSLLGLTLPSVRTSLAVGAPRGGTRVLSGFLRPSTSAQPGACLNRASRTGTESEPAPRFSSAAPALATPAEVAGNSPKLGSPSDKPGDSYFTNDSRPVVLYDGVCNFCNGGVNFVLDNDKTGKLRMAALQSAAGKALLERSGRAQDDISSIVLVEKDRSYTKSEAVLRIGQYLDIPLAALAPLALLTPSNIGDSLYDMVATNRYKILGMRDVCRIDDGQHADRFLST